MENKRKLPEFAIDANGQIYRPCEVQCIYVPPEQHLAGAIAPARLGEPAASASPPRPSKPPRLPQAVSGTAPPRRRSAPRRSSTPSTSSDPLERHARKCCICNHPEREGIEEAFLDWRSPKSIAWEYDLKGRRSVYRHAHATRLYQRRRENLRSVFERVMENAENAKVTAEGIVRVVRAYTLLTGSHQWIEPPTHVIFTSTRALSPASGHAVAPVLIDTPAIRNEPNLQKTKDGDLV